MVEPIAAAAEQRVSASHPAGLLAGNQRCLPGGGGETFASYRRVLAEDGRVLPEQDA